MRQIVRLMCLNFDKFMFIALYLLYDSYIRNAIQPTNKSASVNSNKNSHVKDVDVNECSTF